MEDVDSIAFSRLTVDNVIGLSLYENSIEKGPITGAFYL
jgi:hypothetical protein